MRILASGVLFLMAGAWSVRAQQPTMQNDWDIRKTLDALALHADRLAPFVDQIHPENWIAAGAPEAYVAQAKTCRSEVRAIAASARDLNRTPEKLTGVLQLLFRIRTLESMLGSLGEGLRKYQNPPMADMLNGAISENAGNRDHLQQYALELATAKEQECHVADEEAQRCRQSLSRQTVRDSAPQPEKH
ncbi:MAG: hypothetical protein LAP39_03430 [Acidobacteriia bacterium]|nr:hypothetical protein [Terriglobia bacterium]